MGAYGQARPGTAREICALLSDAPFDEIPVLAQRYSEDPRTQVKHAVVSCPCGRTDGGFYRRHGLRDRGGQIQPGLSGPGF